MGAVIFEDTVRTTTTATVVVRTLLWCGYSLYSTLTSVITWPSNHFFMFLIATTKAAEDEGEETAGTRDNETKNEENDLMFEAHEDALNSFEAMSRKMAFMDILPVLRTMLRSEAARKDTILEVKRSNRAGRFLHYLDSIGLHLDETTRMVLQRPFSIL